MRLRPGRDVTETPDGYVATSTDPWLDVVSDRLPKLRGRFVEITYRLGFWDEPVRPVFRFHCRTGAPIDRIATGPIDGAGIWIGRVPRDATRIAVSPTNRPGPFSFRIESMRTRSWVGLLKTGLRHRPRSTRSAVLTRVIGWGPESDVNLAWATGATPMSDYRAWRAARHRAIELDGIDRPRCDWAALARFDVQIAAGARADVEATLDSLRAQVFPHWTALTTDASAVAAASDARVLSKRASAPVPGTFTLALAAGDRLPPYALAHVAEQARRRPACRLFVGDVILRGDDGVPMPLLRPGWSPRLETSCPPRGAFFIRDVADWPPDALTGFIATGRPTAAMLAQMAPDHIGTLRRSLVETSTADGRSSRDETPDAPAVTGTEVTIIIPTRDHAGLLRRVLAGIRAQTIDAALRIVIVDNSSTDPATLACLADLRREADVSVLAAPQPFNFSAMCNLGAATASGGVLVFLNDDTEFRSADALARLVGHAMQAGVGAVGARMTYPDGRLQHVGVVVGMGGSAGHFGALAALSDPGWNDRNRVVHEVSAVTGACLAVARDKFAAVGGFDAAHLPVELSDIDLCLKFGERGWSTIIDPAIRLMHEESVSRGGATFRRLDVYAEQRRVFIDRWRHVLRDDPYFHPGLSLYSCAAALG